jgi:hypothetical protein
MNATSALGSAVVLFSLAASSASAMTASPETLAANPLIVKTDFVQGHEAVAAAPSGQALVRVEGMMAQRYFDFDVIVTLGALALASGAFVAVGIAGARRRETEEDAAAPREGWRDEVMQALEADLVQFSAGLRRAA